MKFVASKISLVALAIVLSGGSRNSSAPRRTARWW